MKTPDDSSEKNDNKDEDSKDNNDEKNEGSCHQTLVQLVKTSCGDAHNIGLDLHGKAYSLPSPLDFDPFPSEQPHKVTDVVCGKEHCLLLTEHGQGQLNKFLAFPSFRSTKLSKAVDAIRLKFEPNSLLCCVLNF